MILNDYLKPVFEASDKPSSGIR